MDIKLGFELAIENAKALQLVADKSAIEEKYGIACSLNILAAEELVKAQMLLINEEFPFMKIEDFKEIFKEHKAKHNYLKIFASVYDRESKLIQKDHNELFKPVLEFVDNISDDVKVKVPEAIKQIEEYNKFIQKFSISEIEFETISKWLENANNEKNEGFYLEYDFKNEKWKSPNNFSKKRYEKEKKYTMHLFEVIMKFKYGVDEISKELKG